MKKILFLVPYPTKIAPGQRFRFEQYLDTLKNANIKYTICSFLDEKSYDGIYSNKNIAVKSIWIFIAYIKRISHLAIAKQSDFIYIYRETTPLGPPIFEWFIAKILRKKILYDFDDSIWHRDPNESKFKAFFKWKSKVRMICHWSYITICGNEFLADYAKNFAENVRVIPTVINTEYHFLRQRPNNFPLIIGWTGSHSTLVYLDEIMPVLREIHNQFDFKFHIIANRDPGYNDSFIHFIAWNRDSEIEDLQKFDIGLMPLTFTPWSEGKCGFKLIQYGALKIPSVASAVGVNSTIIKNGLNGFICHSKEEWSGALRSLLGDKNLRMKMGENAREKIIHHYSVSATYKDFLSLFKD